RPKAHCRSFRAARASRSAHWPATRVPASSPAKAAAPPEAAGSPGDRTRIRAPSSLAPMLVSVRIFGFADMHPHWRRAEAEGLFQIVDEIAQIRIGQRLRPRGENHEGRRTCIRLGDVAKLDAPPGHSRRLMALQRRGEPAIELRGWDARVPGLIDRE